jgi:hypothetical protein
MKKIRYAYLDKGMSNGMQGGGLSRRDYPGTWGNVAGDLYYDFGITVYSLVQTYQMYIYIWVGLCMLLYFNKIISANQNHTSLWVDLFWYSKHMLILLSHSFSLFVQKEQAVLSHTKWLPGMNYTGQFLD